MHPGILIVGTLVLSLTLAGCGGFGTTPKAMMDYQPETFASKDTHSRRFNHPPGIACEAARRALLDQGYIVSEARADYVQGRKLFQPQPDRHVELAFRIVCAGEGENQRVTRVFVNGVQDQYVMRRVKSSASLGVGGLGSVSLPVQGENDTLIKIGSETVSDHDMYQRLFDLMEKQVDPYVSLGEPEVPPESRKTTSHPVNLPTAEPRVVAPVVPEQVTPGHTVMVLVPMQVASAPAVSSAEPAAAAAKAEVAPAASASTLPKAEAPLAPASAASGAAGSKPAAQQ